MNVEAHRIGCPHCLLGGAVIQVERQGKSYARAELGSPVQCDKCNRPFRVRPRVTFIGEKLEEMAA